MIYRLQNLASKSTKNASAEEASINAQLLERAGYVFKYGAGLYEYLPLGLAVLHKIENIVRRRLNDFGCQEILLTALQPKELWQKTGRWEMLEPNMYQFRDHSEKEVGLAMTHEEPVTELLAGRISSYKDLPLCVYQIQTKFRDELRPKSGLIRGKEFIMKDAYSFHTDQNDFENYYNEMKKIYTQIYADCGLTSYMVEASGGAFSKTNSHEFQVLSSAGEDKLLVCDGCHLGSNRDLGESSKCPECGGALREEVGIEVGNIFQLGTKFSEPLGVFFTDDTGKKQPTIMGCYGLGVSRLVGAVAEIYHDEAGLKWPEAIAPALGHLLTLGEDEATLKMAEDFVAEVKNAGLDLVYDNRALSAGVKLAEADLLGLPYRLVISPKNENKIEIKKRTDTNTKLVTLKEALEILSA